MNWVRPWLKKLRGLVLLSIFLPMPPGHPSARDERQASQDSKSTLAAPYTDQESYQIYAILLEGEKHSLYVIQAEIDGYPGLTSKNLGIKGDKEFLKEWGPVMEDYAKQNQAGRVLKKSFPLTTRYELIPKSHIFPAQHGGNVWDDFYRRFPASGGFYFFSALGFNATRTRAIVDMGHWCGMLCGNGSPHFFEKTDGRWHEVSVKATVSVRAS